LVDPQDQTWEAKMAIWRPDPTFYPSPRMAMKAPPEKLAYVAAFDPTRQRPDTMAIVDVERGSATYSQIVGTVEMPNVGDELHHFGWNACSSCLCPNAPHPHVERRYLVVPGLRSSRIHILDIEPDRRNPKIVKVIEPGEIADKTGYSRPHTVHCGPGGIYVTALGSAEGQGPGGVFMMDHESFEPLGRWEVDRGPQQLGYDAWWHLGYDTMVTSEWGTPDTFENGLVAEILLGSRYGRRLHFWDYTKRAHLQEIDLGEEYQLVFELRPAHDPTKAHGFVNCVVSLKDLSSSIWVWYRDGGRWAVRKIIEIPAEPADPEQLPPILKGFKAVPPFVTDIDLSMDDRFLYVACWGTGELRQYNVSEPFSPKLTGTVRIGGAVSRATHPAAKNGALNGGPQMVEVSRDGRRVYFTNSLYGAIDDQLYPDGVDGWMVKLDAEPDGGIAFDPNFFVDWPKSHRPHQIRLDGGDCSSDSYCYP
jgi:selenium-binding protein 1